MKKIPTANSLLNNLHKGVVLGCIGLTLWGLSVGGVRWYNYFTKTRPAKKEIEKSTLLEN
jgi:hypothetical protein